MAEPTISAAGLASGVSAFTVAFIGVDHYALLWGLVGAAMALVLAEPVGRGRAILFVLLSMLAGAVIGNASAAWLVVEVPVLRFGLCLIGGLLAQLLAATLLRVAPGLFDKAAAGIDVFLSRWPPRPPGGNP